MRKRWCTDLETDNKKDTAEAQTMEAVTAATGATESASEMTESEVAKAPADKMETPEPNGAQTEALPEDKTGTSEEDQKVQKNSPNAIIIVIIIILFLAGAAALFLMRRAIGDEVNFRETDGMRMRM